MSSTVVETIMRLLFRFRHPLILLFNLFLTAFGYVLALGLRFDFAAAEMLPFERLLLPLSLLLLFRIGAKIFWGLNNGYWRYTSTSDLINIIKAHAFSSLLFVAAVGFLRVPGFPRSVIIIEFTLSVLISGGARMFVRLLCEKYLTPTALGEENLAKEVIVLGAGDSGHLLVKFLLSQKRIPYQPVLVLDDAERLVGTQVFNIKVAGPLSSLEHWLQKYPRVSAVLVAIPSLSKARYLEIEEICKRVGIPLKRLQAFEDIAISGSEDVEGPSIEGMLEKEVHVEHEDDIRQQLLGRRVLVTGAGGSIGSELVRQILPFGPAEVTLLDHSEFNLFKVEQEFSANGGETKKHFVLASITNHKRLQGVFARVKPEIVFHAAAYKHVPLMEQNCCEAFVNNVIGTRNVLEVSALSGVKQFVLISSDKAVDPSSLMGCSKRMAEMLVSEYSELGVKGNGHTRMNTAVVRFGNVINSAGSVIPLFKEQILSGGPVTVTHPDMERYFMSIREAVRLVLTAGTLGAEGKIYVLDMGKPIKIVDVAKKMLALYGRRDIPIVFTGVRPGEKLTEELTTAWEKTSGTRFAKVREICGSFFSEDGFVSQWVSELERDVASLEDREISDLMRRFVRSADARVNGGKGEAGAEVEVKLLGNVG